jgi:hypothetical protein
MDVIDPAIPALGKLIEERLALVTTLAESLESSSLGLLRNDAEAIARGAAHQAELCRQWSCLESKLRRYAEKIQPSPPRIAVEDSVAMEDSARLQTEWEALALRIRYLTRVHSLLLRHSQRSLAVLERVINSCEITYTPTQCSLNLEAGLQAGE